jgi:hypothetical protein
MKHLIAALTLAAGLQAAEPNTRAVLAELFTSEGCSSCPPADALLMKLDRTQPVAGVQIIVLSEHVDYWNSLGWNDPYSSAQFTQRQEAYARSLASETYTPQIVIDGRAQLTGGDEKAILAAIAHAATRPKLAVRIVSAKRDDNEAAIAFKVDALPSGKGDVWVALADDRDLSSVRRGENTGKTLTHVAVVRHLRRVGKVTKAAGLDQALRIPLPAPAEGMRVVVFVSESGGPVLGSAMSAFQ